MPLGPLLEVILYVDDMPAAVSFYRDQLGVPHDPRMEAAGSLVTDSTDRLFEPVPPGIDPDPCADAGNRRGRQRL